jgi:hypothetical protein
MVTIMRNLKSQYNIIAIIAIAHYIGLIQIFVQVLHSAVLQS